jgi:NADH-quinone oxidoreductase subunit J
MTAFDTFVQAIFIITAVFILFSIYMTLTVTKTMQAAYWLIMVLVGTAVMFLLANSEIIFALQISIYAGGISVLLLFAALLTQHDDYLFGQSGGLKGLWSQLVIFLLLAFNMVMISWSALNDMSFSGDLADQGISVSDAFEITQDYAIVLWSQYGAVVPILAALLLAALLGSVKLVIREWELEELSDLMKDRYQTEEVAS